MSTELQRSRVGNDAETADFSEFSTIPFEASTEPRRERRGDGISSVCPRQHTARLQRSRVGNDAETEQERKVTSDFDQLQRSRVGNDAETFILVRLAKEDERLQRSRVGNDAETILGAVGGDPEQEASTEPRRERRGDPLAPLAHPFSLSCFNGAASGTTRRHKDQEGDTHKAEASTEPRRERRGDPIALAEVGTEEVLQRSRVGNDAETHCCHGGRRYGGRSFNGAASGTTRRPEGWEFVRFGVWVASTEPRRERRGDPLAKSGPFLPNLRFNGAASGTTRRRSKITGGLSGRLVLQRSRVGNDAET